MEGFSFVSLIKPLGAIALTLLLITAATGLFRRRLGRRFMKVHKTFAWLTVAAALSHAVLIVILFG
jgi:DMSO/TMAO reductase YedYZ heme-binding membrane subunit